MTIAELIAVYTLQKDKLYAQAEQQAAASHFSQGQAQALEKIIEDLKALSPDTPAPDPQPTGEAGSP